SQTRACPLTSSPPIVQRTHKFATSELIITSRRGTRSARTPPTRSVDTCASVQAANASPTSVADPPTPSTAKATAIGAKFVPKKEIVRAAKSKRKLRQRKTSKATRLNTL